MTDSESKTPLSIRTSNEPFGIEWRRHRGDDKVPMEDRLAFARYLEHNRWHEHEDSWDATNSDMIALFPQTGEYAFLEHGEGCVFTLYWSPSLTTYLSHD